MKNLTGSNAHQNPLSSVAAQFAALALVWGGSFLFVRLALRGISPVQVAVGRLILGAIILALIMIVTNRRWPRDPRTLGNLAVVAVLLGVFPFLLFAWAGQYLPSGLSSIYNATTPIMTLLVSIVALPNERFTRARSIALGLGAIGVLVLAAPWRIDSDLTDRKQLLAQLACLGATACYGMGFVYMRRFISGSSYDTVTIAATQVGIGAVIMLCASPFIARTPVDLSPKVVFSMLALGIGGTGIAYIWNTNIVKSWGATTASTVTYVIPIVGVALGFLVLDERLHWNEPIGAVIVVLGILISQGRLKSLWTRTMRHSTLLPVGSVARGDASANNDVVP